MHLRKITIISGITLWAHFSQGIVKFDTLPNLLLTLDSINIKSIIVIMENHIDIIAIAFN